MSHSQAPLQLGTIDRTASAQEIADLARLYKVFRASASEVGVRAMLENKDDRQVVMVARKPAGGIAAVLSILIEQTPYLGSNVLHLEKAAVDPAYRGQSLFGRLYHDVGHVYAERFGCTKGILIACPELVPYYTKAINAKPNARVAMQADLRLPTTKEDSASCRHIRVDRLGPFCSEADILALKKLYRKFGHMVSAQSVRDMLVEKTAAQIVLGARDTKGEIQGVMTLWVEQTPYERSNTIHLEKRAIKSAIYTAPYWSALWRETRVVAAERNAEKAVFVAERDMIGVYRSLWGAKIDPQVSLIAPAPRGPFARIAPILGNG